MHQRAHSTRRLFGVVISFHHINVFIGLFILLLWFLQWWNTSFVSQTMHGTSWIFQRCKISLLEAITCFQLLQFIPWKVTFQKSHYIHVFVGSDLIHCNTLMCYRMKFCSKLILTYCSQLSTICTKLQASFLILHIFYCWFKDRQPNKNILFHDEHELLHI